MTTALDFLPVFSETLARVRARMDQDANAGLLSTDPAFTDTREGYFYWDTTQVAAIECVRLWDALGSETVAAAFPSLAWGEYLDEHGATFQLPRNAATSAEGVVVFTGAPGTLVAANTQVSASPSDPTQDTIVFRTLTAGTTLAALGVPTGITAVPSGTGGTLPAGTAYYHVTSYNLYGETLGSADVPATTTGSTSKVTINFTAVTDAIGYRIYRTLVAGTQGHQVADVTATTFVDTGAITPGALEPPQDTTTWVALAVQAVIPAAAGNLGVNAITTLETLLPTITAVTNPAPTEGGTDVEDDDSYRSRILSEYTGQGDGNMADYARWALAYPGVQQASVIPLWAGAGTVLVVVMLTGGSPVASSVVTGLQAQLDPIAGLGHGIAPVGAVVTIATSTVIAVTIVATVGHEPGYSLTGSGGTVATQPSIAAAVSTYLTSLQPGDTIVYEHVQAAFFIIGVHNVTGLLVNGATADIVLASSPAPQVAQLGTVTLS